MSKTPEFRYDLTILEKDLDAFGHVNNASYLVLYEEARWDLLEKNGFGFNFIQENKVGPVLLDLNLTFRAELKNREKISIYSQSRPIMKNKFIMEMDQRMEKIVNGKVVIASTLTLTVGLMDLQARKLIIPNENWMVALGITAAKTE